VTKETIRNDPAFAIMVMDILSIMLAHADNPAKLGEYLTNELRELTGARCAILIQCLSGDCGREYRVVGVNPARSRSWSESTTARRLYELTDDVPRTQLWDSKDPSEAVAMLQDEGYALSIVIPLNVGHIRVGTMLLLGIPSMDHIESEVLLLNTLASIVALALRNTFLFENQEKIIQERTSDLMLANIELRQSEARFRSVTDSAPDAIISADAEGRITFFNPSASAIFGYAESEVLGKPLEMLMPERFHTAHGSGMARWRETGKGRAIRKITTPFGKRCDGNEFPIELSISSWQSQDTVCFTAIVRDISEQIRTQNELLKTQKLESLSVLAGGIAHDFNNIITSIMGNISFARKVLDPAHKAFNPLDQAEKASVRATELAHQLLTFARGGEPVKKVVSLKNLVKDTVSLILRGSPVRGAVDIPDTIQAIEADEGQISQVFSNIIINATQAMPGGGTLAVTARNVTLDNDNVMALPAGEYVILSFADEGCGIAPENIRKIFDPYFTTKTSGTGLGLASVYSVIRKHGGFVDVQSVLDRGTIFTLYFPSTGTVFSSSQTAEPDPAASVHSGASILVMDDDDMIRKLVITILQHYGYRVETCENGEEAISLYKTAKQKGKPYSVVILDLTIPGGMGGKEAAQHLLSIDSSAKLIVSSGYSNDPIIANYEKYGFCGIVTKPYRVEELGKVLSSLLSNQD
jgi:PAS domain S-box-containing protein